MFNNIHRVLISKGNGAIFNMVRLAGIFIYDFGLCSYSGTDKEFNNGIR